MPAPRRRAVFTGLGLLTPVGADAPSFFDALLAGHSGIDRLTALDPSALPCHLGAEVRGYDGKKYLPSSNRDAKKSLNKMARTVQFGFTTAVRAFEDAGGPQAGRIDPFRFGVEFGCVMVATELEDLVAGAEVAADPANPGAVDLAKWGDSGLARVPPQWMLKYLPNMPACHASIYVNAQGPNNTITSGEVAGTLALGEAFRLIQRDWADAFLVGACDSKLNPVSLSRHSTFQELTRRNDLGAGAVMPYGAERSGFVFGEGAAVFVLEERESALARGARIDAELLGFASGLDSDFTGAGLSGIIAKALEDAQVPASEIDHVNGAGSGSVKFDAFEARAVERVFGPEMPVWSIRAHVGNCGAASGLIELAASVLALKAGTIPGTLNASHTGSDCTVRVSGEARSARTPYALKISLTDLGQCAAAVIRRGD